MVNMKAEQELVEQLESDLPQAMGLIARPLAPEDILPGMHVAVLALRQECFRMSVSEAYAEPKVMRFEQSLADSGEPLLVLAVSVPFVVVQRASGKPRTVDVRRMPLAEVSHLYARALLDARKAHKKRKAKQASKAAKAAAKTSA